MKNFREGQRICSNAPHVKLGISKVDALATPSRKSNNQTTTTRQAKTNMKTQTKNKAGDYDV